MTKGVSIRRSFPPHRGRNNRAHLDVEATPVPSGRAPKIARLMALAIQIDQLIRDGVVVNQAEFAGIAMVTPARLTQILNLANLAPDIQEDILQCSNSTSPGHLWSERLVRPIAKQPCWYIQRRHWTELKRP